MYAAKERHHDPQTFYDAHKLAIEKLKKVDVDEEEKIMLELVMPMLEAAPDLLEAIEFMIDKSTTDSIQYLSEVIKLTDKARGHYV